MASQTQGIQQLLAAEKKAAEKVAEARKREFSIFQNVFSLQLAETAGRKSNWAFFTTPPPP